MEARGCAGAGAGAGAAREPEPGAGRGGAGRQAASARGARPGSAEGGARERGQPLAPAPCRPRATVPPKLQPGRRARPGGRGAGSRPGTRHHGPARTVRAGGGGMGTRQTKGSLAERASPGAAPGPRRERPDFWASLLLRAGDKAGRAGAGLPPYHRRVGMVQELLRMVRQGRREEAGTLLQHLRQVSAGRGRGGRAGPGSAPPLPEEARGRGGAPPRVPSRGAVAGLEQVPGLPLNLRPQGRAEEGWPGEAQPRGTCQNNDPRFFPLQAEEAGPGDGWWEGIRGGMPGLGQGAFLPFYPLPTDSHPLPRGPQGMRSCRLPWGSPRAQPWGW